MTVSELALDSELDLLMIRYNAKHTGAEEGIFPHLQKRNPAIVSYTALAWRQLIRPVKGIEMAPWPGREPVAHEAYFGESIGCAVV